MTKAHETMDKRNQREWLAAPLELRVDELCYASGAAGTIHIKSKY
jgi:hypothetical protein